MRYPKPAGWMGVAEGGKTRLTTVTDEEGFARRCGSGGRVVDGRVVPDLVGDEDDSSRMRCKRGSGSAVMRCDEVIRFPDSVVSCDANVQGGQPTVAGLEQCMALTSNWSSTFFSVRAPSPCKTSTFPCSRTR